MRNSMQASFLGSAEGGLFCLPPPFPSPRAILIFGLVMWVSFMGGR